jgi:hypothetical protein
MRPKRMRRRLSLAGLLLPALLCGCGNPIGIPQHAVAHAQSQHPAWTTSRPGTVYVYDSTSVRIVYTGHLEASQDISVDPIANEITVDGQPVQTNTLDKGHTYQIYFEQAPAGT